MSAASAVCTIPVTGMTCAACSGRVQRSLERTPGVSRPRQPDDRGRDGGVRPRASAERLVEVIRDTGTVPTFQRRLAIGRCVRDPERERVLDEDAAMEARSRAGAGRDPH